MQITIDLENTTVSAIVQSLKNICAAIEDGSIENNELMDGSYRVNDSIVEFIDWQFGASRYFFCMNEPTYTVINRNHGTNWNIGALVKRVSAYNSNGMAMFTDMSGHCVIWAHMNEVKISLD